MTCWSCHETILTLVEYKGQKFQICSTCRATTVQILPQVELLEALPLSLEYKRWLRALAIREGSN